MHPLFRTIASRVLLVATLSCAAAEAPRAGTNFQPAADETEPTRIAIRPSTTDPAIRAFDVPHYVFVDRRIIVERNPQLPPPRNELLLWIPGTLPPGTSGQGPGGAADFCALAARLGYHALVLKYPNDKPAAVCRRDRSPEAFERFRLALIEGGKSPHLTVSRTDSIEHRLIKLLQYLQRTRPAEQWGQYLTAEGGIRWERTAVAGQSQGGGHAALIGIKHRVARVLCFGAPKDHSLVLRQPAAWLSLPSATPKRRFFAFNHDQDRQGCTPAEQRENLRALGLNAFGPAVDVDRASPPYSHSRWLTTNHPGTTVDSSTAHTSVSSGRYADRFAPVWEYMLTEPE